MRDAPRRRPGAARAVAVALLAALALLPSAAPAAQTPFAAASVISSTTADNPQAIHAIDLDGDGDLDVLSASSFDDRIAWYRNNGGSPITWTAFTITATALGAKSVYAADLDGDGDVDVLSASEFDDRIAWYENTAGDGSAWTARDISTAAGGATCVYAADIDGDGDLDVLSAAGSTDTIAWYRNDGGAPPAWTVQTITGSADYAYSVHAADIDGDGDLDVVSASRNDKTVRWHENTAGDGTAWTHRTIDADANRPWNSRAVLAADVDGDGDVDVLCATFTDGEVLWYENDGAAPPAWTPRTITAARTEAESVWVGDIDADGDLDVASASSGDNTIAWYENSGAAPPTWTARTLTTTATTATAVLLADVNADGDLDVLYAASGSDTIAYLDNRTIHRSAAWGAGAVDIGADLASASAVALGDLDRDGRVDIVAGLADLPGGGELKAYRNNGDGTYTPQDVCGDLVGVFALGLADLDRDGDLDIVAGFNGGVAGGELKVFENSGAPFAGAWAAGDVCPDTGPALALALGDLDRDGRIDIVAGFDGTVAGELRSYRNDGTPFDGAWAVQVVSADLDSCEAVALGDLDRDGDLDIVAGFTGTVANEVRAYENDGTPFDAVWAAHDLSADLGGDASFTACAVAVGDLDKDGNPDVAVAWGAGVASEIKVYRNDGTPFDAVWTAQDASGNVGAVHALALADLDRDGDLDLVAGLAGTAAGGEIKWYANDGTPFVGAWTQADISADLADGLAVAVGDLDGDGDLDVVAGLADLAGQGELKWYENVGGQFALVPSDTVPLFAIPPRLLSGATEDLLKVVATHRGRSGDADAELARFDLRFEDQAGTPLTSAQANAIIANLYIYVDTGSGAFESGTDTLVTTVANLALNASGVQTVTFTDGAAGVRLQYGTPRSYFVVVQLTSDAHQQTPSRFSVTLLNASSAGEDRTYDIPLTLEYAADVACTVVIPDVRPTVSAVSVVDGTRVDVTFSEAMGTGATTAANYTVSGGGRGTLAASPNSVTDQGGNTYRLEWLAGEMVDGGDITVTVNNAVQDAAGFTMGTPASGTHAGGGIGTAPTVASVTVTGPNRVQVTFSEPMGTGVATAANYAVSGTGQGSLAANPASVTDLGGNAYRLDWPAGQEMRIGGDVTVTVTGVADTAGNPIGAPNSGTHAGGGTGDRPAVSAVAVVTATSVDVTFSEPMGASALTAANYTVSGTGQGSLSASPTGVADQGGNTFRLTWPGDQEMVIGGDITITAANVADAAGNAIGAIDSGTHAGGGTGTAPTVTAVGVVDALHIDVTFSEAMGAGVTTAANYTLSGTGQGTFADSPAGVALQAGATYRLTWPAGQEMLIGGDVTITVAAVSDLAGNPLGVPNNGTHAAGGTGARPAVTSVSVVDGLHVDVSFSEALGAGATTPANYTLSGSGRGSLAASPDSVADRGGNTCRLAWAAGEMVAGGDVTVTVANVEDLAGNAIGAANSATDAGGGVGVRPTVSAVAVVDTNHVNVTFSEAMGAGVTTPANYTVSGTGRGSLDDNPAAVAPVAGNQYQLSWPAGREMLIGGDITIAVANVTDVAGNVIGPPDSGTAAGAGVGAAPTVTGVNVVDKNTVDVTFSETMGGGATSAANYTVSGSGQGSLAANPTAAALQGGTTYRLTWPAAAEMLIGGDITVTVANAIDLAGNAIGDPNSGTDAGGAVGDRPAVDSVTVQSATTVDVTFSEPMGAGVTTNTFYTVSGTGQGTLAANPTAVAPVGGNTYRLSWPGAAEMFIGGDITITVAGVTDAAGNTIGAANSGTAAGGGTGTRPAVSSVTVVDGLSVDVTFSEPLTGTATTAAWYTLSGGGRGSLAANPASVTAQGGNTYRLAWLAGEMVQGGDVTITVVGVTDLAGNVIGPANSGTDPAGGLGTPPTVTAVAVADGLNVDVTFSEAMGAGVTTPANYTLSGGGRGSLAANPDSVALLAGTTYRLTWLAGEMVDGGDITITVTGAADLAGNGMGVPNSGTDGGGGVSVRPTVTAVSVADGLRVDVTFSETMGAGVTTAANYTLSGTGQGSLAANPAAVALLAGTTYRLTWLAGEMVAGGDITISVAGAADAAGNPIGVPNSATHAGGGLGTAPTVVSLTVQTPTTLDIEFSENMAAGATSPACYTVSGDRGTLDDHPTSAALLAGSTYRLTWPAGQEMIQGGDITVTVTGVTDVAGNPLGVPDSATHAGGGLGTAPTVTAVAVADGLRVDVTFSEAMGAGVTTPASYTLSGSGRGSLAANPDAVALQAGTTYRLTWSTGEMLAGGDITITVAGVRDPLGHLIGVPDSGTHAGGAQGVRPTVLAVTVQDGLTVDVQFSEPVDAAALVPANYALSGSGRGSLAPSPDSVTPQGGDVYRLDWLAGEMVNGGDITITVSNVADLAGNPMGVPNGGTHAGGAVSGPPSVLAVTVVDGANVDVTYDEPMGAGVTTPGNYALSGSGAGSLPVNPTAVALVAGNTYRLSWAGGEMLAGGDITITVSNVQDVAGNPIGPANSGTDIGGAQATPPAVAAVTVVDGLHVDVTFTEPMAPPAGDPAGYTLSGSGRGTLAATPDAVAVQGPATYRLSWTAGEMRAAGDITIAADPALTDLVGNPLGAPAAGTDAGGAVAAAPAAVSITRLDPSPTLLDVVRYRVTFSEAVNGVSADDFTITVTGAIVGPAVSAVTPGPAAVYTVTVSTGAGDGTLRLDVADNDTIVDAAANPLGGDGPGNGTFTAGEVYEIAKPAPSFTSTPPAEATRGVEYRYAITAQDLNTPAALLRFSAPTLPAWLTLTDHFDGTATLAGVPLVEDLGGHDVVLEVRDEAESTAQAFRIDVFSAPVFTSTPPVAALVGQEYAYLVTTSDLDTAALHLPITARVRPAWLRLTDHGDGTATLAGTPAAAQIGPHRVTLRVSDGARFTEQTFTVTVSETADDGGDGPVELMIELLQAPTGLVAGQELECIWRITNAGPGTAPDVLLTVPVPATVEFLGAELLGDDGGPLEFALGDALATILVGPLAPGAAADVAVILRALTGDRIALWAEVSAGTPNVQRSASTWLGDEEPERGDDVVVEEITTTTRFVGLCGAGAAPFFAAGLLGLFGLRTSRRARRDPPVAAPCRFPAPRQRTAGARPQAPGVRNRSGPPPGRRRDSDSGS